MGYSQYSGNSNPIITSNSAMSAMTNLSEDDVLMPIQNLNEI